MVLDPYNDLISGLATQFQLDPTVIKAVILTESEGNPWSCRKEPVYPYLVTPRAFADKLQITLETEITLQMTSIGLMHPMGGVCREHGHKGLLSEVFQPQLSLLYGCLHLQQKAQRYGTDPCTMYAAYNAGSVMRTAGRMFVNQGDVDHFYQNLRALGGA